MIGMGKKTVIYIRKKDGTTLKKEVPEIRIKEGKNTFKEIGDKIATAKKQ
tara:strand:- start:29617 stop:29766 length:150 start_codon:yes stop_codon:yes gene_type:complete